MKLKDVQSSKIVSFYYLRGEVKGRRRGIVTNVKKGLVTIFDFDRMALRSFKPGYSKRVRVCSLKV